MNRARCIGVLAFACSYGLQACAMETGDETSGDVGLVESALSGDLVPLSNVPVPQPIGANIADQAAAVRLGKALFWDMQVGSDGLVACATCHFRAGADTRVFNTLNPGPDHIFASGGVTAPNQTFTPVNIVNDDRVGSQGVVSARFVSIAQSLTSAVDVCTPENDPVFGSARQVTGRNAPTVIGAVFFRDNFWDGRANHVFNGFDPFGGTANAEGSFVSVGNSSLASQASGPPVNDVEMRCIGRHFNDDNSLASKLLPRQALQFQVVSTTDSVLGAFSNAPGNGLQCGSAPCTYQQLIVAAFGAQLAALSQAQFSRFFGLAVQAYEATLIPDQTPLDRFLAGQQNALTSQQQRGLDRFTGKGNCTKCHAGGELSDATVGFAANKGLINEDGGDQGFHNIGVRPTAEDLGRATVGTRVSFSVSGSAKDRGAFKTASLRNVKLTAPYFHNGGKRTLADVVDFYNRGGDFANPELAKRIQPLSLDAGDRAALVDFLTNGLTDCRVEKERAPFDHPALTVPNGPTLPAVGQNGTGSCP